VAGSIAKGRDTPLTPEEIARTALNQFDTSAKGLSMRALARELGVVAGSIYNHFPSENAIIQAALALVYEESVADYVARRGNPLVDPPDPEEFLVESAVSIRRALVRHYRITPYLGLMPMSSPRLAGIIGVFSAALEQLGLFGDDAGEALFAFGHYVYGSAMLSGSGRLAAEQTAERHAPFSTAEDRPPDTPMVSGATFAAVDRAISFSGSGTDEEEELFVKGVRRLIAGFTEAAGRPGQ
jgi:AcrR family transcriptional regulator